MSGVISCILVDIDIDIDREQSSISILTFIVTVAGCPCQA